MIGNKLKHKKRILKWVSRTTQELKMSDNRKRKNEEMEDGFKREWSVLEIKEVILKK